jgi:6-pyruvoyltetrahydropterin/6-carboxytetrahydropterin synthase
LTRRYRLAASHRLYTPALSEEENRRLFGKCSSPHGHGHDYAIEISVEGPPDSTGQVANRMALDALVKEYVLEKLDHKNLNVDVPEFRDAVPTTENLARVVRTSLEKNWALGARLVGVGISETARNSVAWRAEPTVERIHES